MNLLRRSQKCTNQKWTSASTLPNISSMQMSNNTPIDKRGRNQGKHWASVHYSGLMPGAGQLLWPTCEYWLAMTTFKYTCIASAWKRMTRARFVSMVLRTGTTSPPAAIWTNSWRNLVSTKDFLKFISTPNSPTAKSRHWINTNINLK